MEKGCSSDHFCNGLYYQLNTRTCELYSEIKNKWNSLSCAYSPNFAFVRESMFEMSNQIISSKFWNFHAAEVEAIVLWDEKNLSPLSLKSKIKKKFKSSEATKLWDDKNLLPLSLESKSK